MVYTHRKKQATRSVQLFFIHALIAFLLPVAIMAGLLALRGIWWGSSTTILASDSFHQYVIFHQALRNTLHGQGSLFYNFTIGLGINFYALSTYYLGSFFSPLVYFFDLNSMPDFLYLMTIVKFGLTGLSSFISLSSIYTRLRFPLLISLSTSFALMSFTTSQFELFNWLDVFLLLPLILLGLHRLFTGKGGLLYYISLTCLFLQQYYFGYITSLFLIVWSLGLLSWNVKVRIRYLLDFVFVSFLAACSSMITLLPTFFDLRAHGETLTQIDKLKTPQTWYLDLIAKNLVGNFDTTKFDSLPMVYVGLFPILLTLLFFTVKTIHLSIKLTYGSIFLLVIASFYLEPLNLFWQGMHAPNMFLYRYAWIFSTLLIYLAAETLSRWEQVSLQSIYSIVILFCLALFATYLFRSHYPFLEEWHFLLTAVFLLVYSLLLYLSRIHNSFTSFIPLTLLVFTSLEMSVHTDSQLHGIAAEWHFPSRKYYQEKLTEIDTLVRFTKEHESHFYRMERLLPQTGNDGMKFNYNSISQFSSIRNRSSSSILDKLGFRSDGTNLNLRYQNNTLIADALFGIAYNVTDNNPLKFGFTLADRQGPVALYRNHFHQQLALLINGSYKDIPFTHLTLDNQTHFLNHITGLNEHYYEVITPLATEGSIEFSNRVTATKSQVEEYSRVTYTLLVPKYSQLYVNLPNLTLSNENSKKVVVTVKNQSNEFTLDNSFSFFNAGYFLDEEQITLALSFPHNEQVSFDPPQFFRLNLTAFEKAMTVLKQKEVRVTSQGNTLTAQFQAIQDSSLLFTIPYDKGWSASLERQQLPVTKAQKGFLAVTVPKGKGTVTLTFIPYGFKSGALLSLLGIFLFFCYWYKKKPNLVH